MLYLSTSKSVRPGRSLAPPAHKQSRPESDQSRQRRMWAWATAAIVLQHRRVAVLCSALGRLVAAYRALDQGRLVGGGPLLRLVWAGAVAGPLTVEQQVASVSVLLHAEELVLGVGEADPQRHAAVGHSHILLHPHLPGPLDPTLVTVEDIEERGGGHVHGRYSHVVHWKRKTRQRVSTRAQPRRGHSAQAQILLLCSPKPHCPCQGLHMLKNSILQVHQVQWKMVYAI